MNSALQCQINTPELAKYQLSNAWMAKINATNTIGSQGHVLCVYAYQIKTIYTIKESSYRPSSFKKLLSRENQTFAGYEQQDSQEFLSFQMDTQHEDLNQVQKKPYIEYKDYDNGSLDKYSKECWANFKQREDSIMINHFYGQFQSTVICPDCNFVSITFDTFNMISLPLPSIHNSSKIKIEGYVLRFETAERNLNFNFKGPPNILGTQILQNICDSNHLERRCIRAFWISKCKIAGEFAPLEEKTAEFQMGHESHQFFCEMYNPDVLEVEGCQYNNETPVIGILYWEKPNNHALERLVYYPFKKWTVAYVIYLRSKSGWSKSIYIY